MNQTWDVTINGITYHLVLIRGKNPAISINGEAPILLSKLKKKFVKIQNESSSQRGCRFNE